MIFITSKNNHNVVTCLPAQDCVLQLMMSLPDPEQFPPFSSALVLVRDLDLVPPPQDLEQGNQVDQAPQTQSSEKKAHYFKT